QLSADDLAVLLRRRHAAEVRAHRGDALARRDPRLPRSRQHRLSESRGSLDGRRLGPPLVLPLVLHGDLSGAVPARRGDVPAARAEAGQRKRDGREVTAVRVLCAVGGCWFFGVAVLSAQEPTAPQAVSREQLQSAINKLGDLDYATRTAASRTVRRTP